MAETRHAQVTWSGDLISGAGTIDYVSSGVLARMPVSWAARTGPHNGMTSPEELLAAAHGACFSMAFSARLAKNGTPPDKLNVKAEVTFDNASGGWKVTTSHITVVGEVPGIDLETFRTIADDAKENCPISIALKGNVELSVDASLAADA
jgi:osmotically inducible protein OsmC